MPPIVFVVDRREAGKTLASALKMRFGLSWSQAKRLVERRHVRVGQQVEVDVARRLKLGKKVQLDAGTIEVKSGGPVRKSDKPDPKATPRTPAKVKGPRPEKRSPGTTAPDPLIGAVEVVYSDDAVVVVNKPAGLTTMRHGSEAEEFGPRGKHYLPKTLADVLPGLLGAPDRRVIAVHRIDRDTSGLVVFARTPAAAESLSKQFRKHTVDRRYLALTRGLPQAGRVESVFVPDRGDGRRGSTRKTNPPDGKRAVTHVRVVEELGGCAAVECRLETGRTHQVRIHLGETGSPLCGERLYDRPVNGRPAPDASSATRPMLHAARLGFTHPETAQPVVWDVKPPADFAGVWAALRQQNG